MQTQQRGWRWAETHAERLHLPAVSVLLVALYKSMYGQNPGPSCARGTVQVFLGSFVPYRVLRSDLTFRHAELTEVRRILAHLWRTGSPAAWGLASASRLCLLNWPDR